MARHWNSVIDCTTFPKNLYDCPFFFTKRDITILFSVTYDEIFRMTRKVKTDLLIIWQISTCFGMAAETYATLFEKTEEFVPRIVKTVGMNNPGMTMQQNLARTGSRKDIHYDVKLETNRTKHLSHLSILLPLYI